MGFQVTRLSPDDITQAASLRIASFRPDPWYRAIFPNASSHFDNELSQITSGLEDPRQMHLICKDTDSLSRIASYITIQFRNSHDHATEDNPPSPGCNPDAYEILIGGSSRRRRALMLGSGEYIHAEGLCTAFNARGRGAASCLLRAVQKLADEKCLPVFLQGAPDAVSLYQKLGWTPIDNLHWDLRPWSSPVSDAAVDVTDTMLIYKPSEVTASL